jgi:hypothetical protein
MFGWISKILGLNSPVSKSLWEMELEKRETTKPINFGYKCVWAAVKTLNTDDLLAVLKLDGLKRANWVEGLLLPGKENTFILPPIEGWILISGFALPTPDHEKGIEESKGLLDKLSKKFGEAQLFGNVRASETAFWMKSVNGQTIRLYCITDGKNFIEGEPTEIEKKWDLIDTNSKEAKNEEYWDKMLYPDAEHVLEVAKNWSINPMELEEKENVGEFGYIGVFSVK